MAADPHRIDALCMAPSDGPIGLGEAAGSHLQPLARAMADRPLAERAPRRRVPRRTNRRATVPTPTASRGSLSRRDVLKAGAALAGAAATAPLVAPGRAAAQTPRRGGTVTIRAWDPPHFDPHLTISYKTHIAY